MVGKVLEQMNQMATSRFRSLPHNIHTLNSPQTTSTQRHKSEIKVEKTKSSKSADSPLLLGTEKDVTDENVEKNFPPRHRFPSACLIRGLE
ncbi:hypothetical protein JTE90_022122 [Oedothorax gibbosus]|uniref:Uncharacterized protein n=1 Tax=Oedothorax gibbosus TaxID=931172 RepID=A0AAV6VSL1_9ARAC|nr:hypothetical protein JTE90_022122 [Oedothorax gibbosus]